MANADTGRPNSASDLRDALRSKSYLADDGLGIGLFLALSQERPDPRRRRSRVGKTELASALAGELRASNAPVSAAQPVEPVCGMGVDPGSSLHRAKHHGVTYHFRSVWCRDALQTDPDRHLATARST